jgi:hypothetical protein
VGSITGLVLATSKRSTTFTSSRTFPSVYPSNTRSARGEPPRPNSDSCVPSSELPIMEYPRGAPYRGHFETDHV